MQLEHSAFFYLAPVGNITVLAAEQKILMTADEILESHGSAGCFSRFRSRRLARINMLSYDNLAAVLRSCSSNVQPSHNFG